MPDSPLFWSAVFVAPAVVAFWAFVLYRDRQIGRELADTRAAFAAQHAPASDVHLELKAETGALQKALSQAQRVLSIVRTA